MSARLNFYRVGMSIAAAAIAWHIGQSVYQDTPLTTDENSYIFQAHVFLDGLVKRPAPDCMDWFQGIMVVLDPDLGWFSRYPPGHSLWLMPGVLAGSPRLMSALAAGASLWLMTGVVALTGAPALLAGIGLLLSPYFLFMHGTLLSHTSSMLAISLMLYFYALWSRRRRYAAIALAGCAWSFLCLDRPYTAFLVAAPFAFDSLAELWRAPDRRAWAGTLIFGACAAAGPLLTLCYNQAVTGDPLMPPFMLYTQDHSSGLGFSEVHTPRVAFACLAANLKLLDKWLLGFSGSLAFFAALAAAGWDRRWSPFCLAGIASITLGHLLFYYPGVNTCGPFYYFETLPFFIVLLGLAGRRALALAQKRPALMPILKALALIALAAAGLVSARFMLASGADIRASMAELTQLCRTAKSAPPGAIVLVKNVDKRRELDMARLFTNPRGLASDPLIMLDMGDCNTFAARFFPGRSLWLLDGREPRRLTPLSAPRRMTLDLDLSACQMATGRTALEGARHLRRAGPGDAAGYLVFGAYCIFYPGEFELACVLDCAGVSSNAPVVCDLAADRGKSILAARSIAGPDGPREIVLPFKLERSSEIEPRVFYGGEGRLTVRSMALREKE